MRRRMKISKYVFNCSIARCFEFPDTKFRNPKFMGFPPNECIKQRDFPVKSKNVTNNQQSLENGMR